MREGVCVIGFRPQLRKVIIPTREDLRILWPVFGGREESDNSWEETAK